MTVIAPMTPIAMAPHAVLDRIEFFTGTSPQLLAGPEKTQPITRMRHEAMWILRQLTTMSFAAIGHMFGGRDLATVQAGVGNVADRMGRDSEYRDRMRFLLGEIAHPKLNFAPASPLAAISPPRGDIRLAAARGILADPALSDADARAAALHMLGEARHGA